MSFSAFSRFGHTGFSGQRQLGQVIYESALAALGPAYDDGFNDSHRTAALYADAMGLASVVWTLRRTRNNNIALKCTDLLSALETIYGLTPAPGETERRRRERLHVRMLIARGGRLDVVGEIMATLFGASFLSWVVADADTLLRFPDTEEEAAAVGNFVPPGTRARILQTTGPIFPGVATVDVVELSTPPEQEQAMVGLSFCVDPGVIARRESATFTDVTQSGGRITRITATFLSAHDVGAVLTTQYMPLWLSNAHWHTFRFDEAGAQNATLRQDANEELRRVMKSIARWELTQAGPFTVGEGLLGITELG